MASGRIKGITIEIDGNVTPLQKALESADKSLKDTQSELRDVNKLLKLDPSNVTLLQQKHDLLTKAIEQTNDRLETLKSALGGMDEGTEEYNRLQREVIATEQSLGKLEQQQGDVNVALSGGDVPEAAGDMEDLADATEDAADEAKGANSGWSGFKQVIADLATNAIQAAINGLQKLGKAIKETVVDSAAYADEIMTLSTQTGIATDKLQEYQYMAELVDVDVSTITGSLRKLTTQMDSAASGSGAAAEAFASLGVSVTDSEGNLRSNQDVFDDVIDALGQIENTTQRDALAMDIFGRSAQDLNPLIAAGSEGIAAFAEEAREAGYVLDDETLESLGSVDDELQRFETRTTAVKNNLVSAFAPALADAGEEVNGFVTSLIGIKDAYDQGGLDGALGAAGEMLDSLGDRIAEALPQIVAMGGKILMSLVQGLVTALPGIIETGSLIIVELLTGLSQSLPQLVAMLPEIISSIVTTLMANLPMILQAGLQLTVGLATGIIGAIPELISMLPEIITSIVSALLAPETLQAIGEAGIELLCALVTDLPDIIVSVVGAVVELFGAIIDFLTSPEAFEAFKETGEELIEKFKSGITEAWEEVKSTVGQKLAGIVSSFSESWNQAKTATIEAFNNIKSELTSKIDSIKSNVTTKFTAIKTAIITPIESAKSKVKEVIDKIKGFFDFQWSLPSLKMPHFTASGKFSLNPIQVPTFSISWYDKAMENGMILDGATIFGAKGNTLLGGGESGPEAIIGVNSLHDIITEAVRSAAGMGGNDFNITIVQREGQNAQKLVDVMQSRINAEIGRRKAVFA